MAGFLAAEQLVDQSVSDSRIQQAIDEAQNRQGARQPKGRKILQKNYTKNASAISFFSVFVLILYIPVNNFLVISRPFSWFEPVLSSGCFPGLNPY